MSLLQDLPYKEAQQALLLSVEQCNYIAKLANLRISYEDIPKAGEKLLHDLYRRGYSINQYRQFRTRALDKLTTYKPHAKVAILIGNTEYKHLPKLAAPSKDCDLLATHLKNLGFITVIIKNPTISLLKTILNKLFSVIPHNSYIFIFYGGHGFELCNVKHILCVDCPDSDIHPDLCLTENYILKKASECKPELCLFIMDMCGKHLERDLHKELFKQVPDVDSYAVDTNLLICYSTQSGMSAYEVVDIDCSQTIGDTSYILKTNDFEHIHNSMSQYVKAMCYHLEDRIDVNTMLDRIHTDLENAPKKQKPIKIQSCIEKRSLHDESTGNKNNILELLENISNEYGDKCRVS